MGPRPGGRAIVCGAHDYIELPAHPSLDFRQRFSVELWLKPPAQAGQAQFLAKGPLEQGWDLWYDPPGKLNLRIGGFTGPDDASSPVLKADQWNHVVWTYDGTLAEKSVKLYVNGELKQTRNKPGTAKTNDKPLTVGVVVHRVLITHVGGTNRTQNHPEERANLLDHHTRAHLAFHALLLVGKRGLGHVHLEGDQGIRLGGTSAGYGDGPSGHGLAGIFDRGHKAEVVAEEDVLLVRVFHFGSHETPPSCARSRAARYDLRQRSRRCCISPLSPFSFASIRLS